MRGEQRLGMAGRRQVDGDVVGVGISGSIEIDRRLDPHPLSLRRRWVGTKQIIKSQTSPPRNRAPAFDANQPRNLLVYREASHETANIEGDTLAGGQPIQSQMPSRDIPRIWSSSVVIVPERSNLRFVVRRHHTISRVKRFCHVIVDTKSSVEKPLLPGRVHLSAQAETREGILWQERSATRQRCHRSSPKQQNVAPGAATQHLRIHLEFWEKPLSEEASSLICHWRGPPIR